MQIEAVVCVLHEEGFYRLKVKFSEFNVARAGFLGRRFYFWDVLRPLPFILTFTHPFHLLFLPIMAKKAFPNREFLPHPHRVQSLNIEPPQKISLLFCLLLLMGVGLSIEANAQPTCVFSALADGTGIVTVNLTNPNNGCPNVIDWGDGCTNNNTNNLIKHRYSSCGTYTITHTVRFGIACTASATCTQAVTTNMSAAQIIQSSAEEVGDCGVVEKLKTTVAPANGCLTVSQDVTITGTFPSAQFDVVNSDYSVSGNTVTRVVTAAQINAGTTVELWLRPKYCTSVTPGTVALTATAPSMMLSSQNLFCEPPLSGPVMVPLNWTVTPKPACLSISKVALNPNAAPGENLQYRVTLTNTGTGPAQNVPVTDNFPSGLTPVALPSGASVTGNMIIWTSGSAPAGGSLQYDLTFSTPGTCPGSFENCAEATACGNKVGPACATINVGTGNMSVVQVTGNMYVSSGSAGLPVPAGLPNSGSTTPFIIEFAPFSTLTINATYHFVQGCIFRMREGAEIIVQGGKQLTLGPQTHLSSCDKMWKGIRLEDNGSLHIAKSYISDAQYAIHAQQNINLLWMTENVFADNFVGFYMPSGVAHTWKNHHIFFNKFIGTQPLKPTYAGMPPIPSGARSYAGILINNLRNALTVGGGNGSFSGLFEGMAFGIQANNCGNITVSGNQFKHLTNSTYPKSRTYGIWARNGAALLLPTLRVTGFGKNSAKLTFEDCSVGVYASAYHLNTVSQCNMAGVLCGVEVENGQGRTLITEKNKISTTQYGTLFQNCLKAKKIRIFDNTVTFPTATGTGQSGIALFSCSPIVVEFDEYHVEMNIVTARGTRFGGIHLSASSDLDLHNNTVDLYQTHSQSAGINVEGGTNNRMIYNHCFGQDATAETGERVSGIRTTMTAEPLWCCNDVQHTRNGIFVEGYCANVGSFWGNMMDDHTYGLRFGGSGVMGLQLNDQGNTWSSSAGSVWQAWHEGGTQAASFSPFNVTQAAPFEPIPANPALLVGGMNGVKWFAPMPPNSPVEPFTCLGLEECDTGQAPPGTDAVEDSVAVNSFTMPYHTDGSIWTARRNLYARLSRYPVLAPAGSHMAAFRAAHQNAEIGRLDAVAQAEAALFALNPSDSSAAANYYANAQGLTAQMAAIDTQMLVASPAQQQVLLDQKAALQAQYDTNQQSAELFWQSIQQQRLNTADQLLAQNTAIVTTTLQGTNEKIWHGIYLSKLLRGDFDLSTGQMSDLESVAYQCPLDGGGVVYAARGAWEMVQDTIIAWVDNCGSSLQEGGGEDRNDSVTTSAEYKIFPNPVKDILNVDVPASQSDERNLAITDILGNIVTQSALSKKGGILRVPLGTEASGVYWLTIREKGRVVFSSKIIKF